MELLNILDGLQGATNADRLRETCVKAGEGRDNMSPARATQIAAFEGAVGFAGLYNSMRQAEEEGREEEMERLGAAFITKAAKNLSEASMEAFLVDAAHLSCRSAPESLSEVEAARLHAVLSRPIKAGDAQESVAGHGAAKWVSEDRVLRRMVELVPELGATPEYALYAATIPSDEKLYENIKPLIDHAWLLAEEKSFWLRVGDRVRRAQQWFNNNHGA
jgi:hypothetical protein